MGANYMRLINLKIEKLHNSFNYNVDFNDDVTFIYGCNGCGKTTILNITEIIITGRLYYLFDYDFEKITMCYEPIKKPNDYRYIIIEKKKHSLEISFNMDNIAIDINDMFRQFDHRDDRDNYYFRKYPILCRIKDSFNYVYLPLNRRINGFDRISDELSNKRLRNSFVHGVHYDDMEMSNKYYYDFSIDQVLNLIQDYYRRTSIRVAKINNEFRNSILKSSMDIFSEFNVNDFIVQIGSPSTKNDIQRIQKAYIKIAKDFEIFDDKEEKKYDRYFQEYLDSLSSSKTNKEIGIELITKYLEISRIKKIVTMANKMEKQKEQCYKSLEMFLSTINAFIKSSDDKKELKIDEMGKLYFETGYSDKKINIQHLSSGEKQLVIFFANLIFRVEENRSGIFVVDEPEMSLHLSWQKMFVEKTLTINNNIQLVFATHSPEFVGKYRKKLYKLDKEYVG